MRVAQAVLAEVTTAMLAALIGGCAPPAKPPVAQGRPEPSDISHVRVQPTPLGELPNSGLFLPAVSPTGDRMAYLSYRGDQPPELEAALSGRLPEGMALYVRAVEDGPERLVAAERAGWPAWSADGRTLYYVSGDAKGANSLCVYDVQQAQTVRRVTPGPAALLMPAISHDGTKAAFIAPAAGQSDWRLHVLALDSGEVTLCPATAGGVRQGWPQWAGDGRLVYIEAAPQGAWVCQWAVGQSPPQRVRPVGVAGEPAALFQACAGLAGPLSPQGRWYASYDAGLDAIVLTDLWQPDKTLTLREGTRAGCWLGEGQYVVASSSQLSLFAPGGPSAMLMRGTWLPIGRAGAEAPAGRGGAVLCCAPGPHAWVFQLVRLAVTTSPEP